MDIVYRIEGRFICPASTVNRRKGVMKRCIRPRTSRLPTGCDEIRPVQGSTPPRFSDA